MKNKNINEDNSLSLNLGLKDIEKMPTGDLDALKKLQQQKKVKLNVTAKGGGTSGGFPTMTEQPEAVIKPQDKETIKYLSNVVDGETGEVSKPFEIANKKYQMVRGITPNREVVMGVYCFDDLNESGENIIHPVDHFEETIARPMKEAMAAPMGQDIQPIPEKASNLSEFKHYIINKKNGKVRKFKSIEELAKANMTEDESYMNLPQFKKHVAERLFGSKHRSLKEVMPTGVESDEEMNAKAQKLMDVIKSNSRINNIIGTIKTPVAQREVIAAFAELVGVKRNQLPQLINNLKDLAKQQAQPQQQAQQVTENVIKVIKVKDIK
jgi:hypothetical protein